MEERRCLRIAASSAVSETDLSQVRTWVNSLSEVEDCQHLTSLMSMNALDLLTDYSDQIVPYKKP